MILEIKQAEEPRKRDSNLLSKWTFWTLVDHPQDKEGELSISAKVAKIDKENLES